MKRERQEPRHYTAFLVAQFGGAVLCERCGATAATYYALCRRIRASDVCEGHSRAASLIRRGEMGRDLNLSTRGDALCLDR
jgi:hypothetical protein